jgi:hypothetical protein
VIARSKAWVCGRSLAGILGKNPAEGMKVYLLWSSCVVRYRSLRRADYSFRGVLPNAVCLHVIAKPWWWEGPPSLRSVAPWKLKIWVPITIGGNAVKGLVEALCYKPEGRRFDSRWCLRNFRPHYDPGVHSASNRNEYQEYLLRGEVKAAGA